MRDEPPAQDHRSTGLKEPASWRVTQVTALPGYRLSVRFADGTQGEVDASRLILGPRAGVFSALRDPALFARVGVEHGAVTWPGGLDLAPDAMYAGIHAQGCWTPA